MGQTLERRTENKLRTLLRRFATGKASGLLAELIVTELIQSSLSTIIMSVGFINSGLITLKHEINMLIGANISITVTARLLSLAGSDSGNP